MEATIEFDSKEVEVILAAYQNTFMPPPKGYQWEAIQKNYGGAQLVLIPEIDIKEINLYEAMNSTIASLLKIRNNDICSMYAAKLIESLQKENAELKARLDYIRNGNSRAFIPPENSTNRGED